MSTTRLRCWSYIAASPTCDAHTKVLSCQWWHTTWAQWQSVIPTVILPTCRLVSAPSRCSVTSTPRLADIWCWGSGLIIEFPPGATALIPSAIITHHNMKVLGGETRYSFMQYTTGLLFTYIENGMRLEWEVVKDPKLTSGEKQRRVQARREHWGKDLALFPHIADYVSISWCWYVFAHPSSSFNKIWAELHLSKTWKRSGAWHCLSWLECRIHTMPSPRLYFTETHPIVMASAYRELKMMMQTK